MLFTRPSHWKNKIAVSQAAGRSDPVTAVALFLFHAEGGSGICRHLRMCFSGWSRNTFWTARSTRRCRRCLRRTCARCVRALDGLRHLFRHAGPQAGARLAGKSRSIRKSCACTSGVPQADSRRSSSSRKIQGVAGKRRAEMPYAEAFDWLCRGCPPAEDGQILREIAWFCSFMRHWNPPRCCATTAPRAVRPRGRGPACHVRRGDPLARRSARPALRRRGARLIRDGKR